MKINLLEHKLLTRHEVLALLSIKKTKLYNDIKKGFLPPPVRIGATRRWRLAEIEAYLELWNSNRRVLVSV
ncbi:MULTISPECIES: helix-turn-helix domain-containing protein [Ramlibacter]|uniref:Helix-turn-helix domain-containing protein n=1 Tax=Ramlibacter aquaticus TaxID=2780094 RepID=A0ABR9SI14_9BURK|nr:MULTISPECIES: helix-turn-helix domain-containing protein [Ramlibacter]MBE7942008.1 helix-turn-helix domain-containing protein [Ramlibacter aquaticus]